MVREAQAPAPSPGAAGRPVALAAGFGALGASPGDLASGLLAAPAWAIAALGLFVVGVVVAGLLLRRRKARRN